MNYFLKIFGISPEPEEVELVLALHIIFWTQIHADF